VSTIRLDVFLGTEMLNFSFSKHPDIALPHLEPHSYGLVFLKTAKNMLGNMLAVPTRETVIALVLLAGICHGIGAPIFA
jgi:hypothetical protein